MFIRLIRLKKQIETGQMRDPITEIPLGHYEPPLNIDSDIIYGASQENFAYANIGKYRIVSQLYQRTRSTRSCRLLLMLETVLLPSTAR